MSGGTLWTFVQKNPRVCPVERDGQTLAPGADRAGYVRCNVSDREGGWRVCPVERDGRTPRMSGLTVAEPVRGSVVRGADGGQVCPV